MYARRFIARPRARSCHSFVVLQKPNSFIVPPKTATPNDSQSYTSLGKGYEIVTADFLSRCHFSVEICGQAGDHGIDFRGYWHLPDRSLPVIGQCKKSKHKLSTKFLRELSGSMESEKNTLGVMVCETEWTKEAYAQFNISKRPLMMCQLNGDLGILEKALMNGAARDLIPKLSVGKSANLGGDEIVFLYQGQWNNSTHKE